MTHIVGARVRNIGPFRGEFELELGPGCYGIFAKHVDDAGRSNGLGKSYIVAGIRWALDGKKVEDVDTLDEMISLGEDEMGFDLELSDGLFISRAKKRGKSSSLEVTTVDPERGERKLKGEEAQEEIERSLGISVEDRLTTCWAEQKELDTLTSTSTTSAALTNMIETWLGIELERLIEAGDLASKRLAIEVEKHQKAVSQLSGLEAAAAEVEVRKTEVATLELKYSADSKVYDRKLTTFNAYAKRELCTEQVEELRTTQEDLDALLKEEKKAPKSDYAATVKAVELRTRDYEASKSRLTPVIIERGRLAALVRGEFDGACPVSKGFKCPVSGVINARVAQNRIELGGVEDTLRDKEKELENFEDELTEAREVSKSAWQVERDKVEREALKKQLVSRIERLENALMAAKNHGTLPLSEAELRVPPERPGIPDKDALVRAKMVLEAAEKAAAALPAANELVEETAKVVRAHELAEQLLGPLVARRKVAERAVALIQNDANARLYSAGIPLKVTAAWGRETNKLAEQCEKCGSKFPASAKVKSCERCGVPRGNKIEHEFRWRLSFTSGAGRDLAGLALRVAGYTWLKMHRGVSWSVAVLDEPGAQLDRSHRSAVAAGIRKLLVGTFEQAFLTSHDQAMLESCDKKILITGTGYEPVRSKIEVLR